MFYYLTSLEKAMLNSIKLAVLIASVAAIQANAYVYKVQRDPVFIIQGGSAR